MRILRGGSSALAVIVMLAAPRVASAQDVDLLPIFVAIPDEYPNLDARVVLVRQPGRDVILLDPEEPSPESLWAALGLLRRLRAEDPRPARGQTIPVTGFAFRRDFAPEDRALMEGVLARLADRPVGSVGDLGPGRWIRLDARRRS